MTPNECQNYIIDYIVENKLNKYGQDLNSETHITRDLGLDSLEIMELIECLEDVYAVEIPLNILPDINTIGELGSALVDISEGRISRRWRNSPHLEIVPT